MLGAVAGVYAILLIKCSMPIQVTCPECRTRFSVSEKFAGQTGPCPKCKSPIKVPEKGDEVVIHAPDQFGPKDTSGRATLKPLERQETEVTPVSIVGVVAVIVGVLLVAFILGRAFSSGVPRLVLGAGAVLLAPPIAMAGYGILRDQELAAYRGLDLIVRATLCGLVYALLWGAYAFLKGYLFGGNVEIFHLTFLVPALLAVGGVAPLASLDLDFMSGVLHFGLYLLVTDALRLIMGLPAW